MLAAFDARALSREEYQVSESPQIWGVLGEEHASASAPYLTAGLFLIFLRFLPPCIGNATSFGVIGTLVFSDSESFAGDSVLENLVTFTTGVIFVFLENRENIHLE